MNRPGETAVHATWVSCWPLSSKPWLVYRTSVSTTDRPKKKLARMLAGLGLATIETVAVLCQEVSLPIVAESFQACKYTSRRKEKGSSHDAYHLVSL